MWGWSARWVFIVELKVSLKWKILISWEQACAYHTGRLLTVIQNIKCEGWVTIISGGKEAEEKTVIRLSLRQPQKSQLVGF